MKGGDHFEGFGLNSGIILKLVSGILCELELASYDSTQGLVEGCCERDEEPSCCTKRENLFTS